MLIRSPFLVLLLDWMRTQGASQIVDALRTELALPEPSGTIVKEMSVPISVFRTVSELAAERMGAPFLGLRVAAGFPRGSYGILELTAHHAPTVGEALTRMVHYLPLIADTRLELRKLDDEFALVHRVLGEPLCLGRHGNEFVLAALLRIAREGAETSIRPTRVEFAHPAPADVSELVKFFETTNIHFGADRNRLVFDADVFSIPIPSSDDRLLPWLDNYAKALLPPESVRADDIPGLHEQIRICLQTQTTPTLREIARRIRLSPRTLQRRLQDARSSFQSELEEVRRELADSYLRDPTWSIKAIALRLGYSDRSGFERAFMKWRRTTPGEFRRALVPRRECMQDT